MNIQLILTDYWHHKMHQNRFAGLYWDLPRILPRRRHSVDPFRIALSIRRSFVGIYRKSLLRLRTRVVDGLAVLLYVQRDAYCDTANENYDFKHRRLWIIKQVLTLSSVFTSKYAENSTSLNFCVAIDRPSHGCCVCKLPSIAETAVADFTPPG